MGLEAEYWVVDETGALCSGRDLTTHEHVTPEFVDSMIEVETPPVESCVDLRESFSSVLETVLGAAGETDRRLVPLGTPLSAQTLPIGSARGKLLERIYGEGIEPAKNCAGTHVHFDRENTTRQLNLLTALDPALALVSSSPYYRGERLVNCSRARVYRRNADVRFERYRDLWAYTTDLDEWEDRIEACYRSFRSIARETGIDAETFAERFQPENAVLTPVRLRQAVPTVEWRAPDTALPSQVLSLVDTVVQLLDRVRETPVEIGTPAVTETSVTIPPFSELRALSEAAIENGLHSPAVREYLETMGFDHHRYRPITDSIVGPDRLDEESAREFRLAYADALEADVAALSRQR